VCVKNVFMHGSCNYYGTRSTLCAHEIVFLVVLYTGQRKYGCVCKHMCDTSLRLKMALKDY
jgi:hypothetical protein